MNKLNILAIIISIFSGVDPDKTSPKSTMLHQQSVILSKELEYDGGFDMTGFMEKGESLLLMDFIRTIKEYKPIPGRPFVPNMIGNRCFFFRNSNIVNWTDEQIDTIFKTFITKRQNYSNGYVYVKSIKSVKDDGFHRGIEVRFDYDYINMGLLFCNVIPEVFIKSNSKEEIEKSSFGRYMLKRKINI